MSFIFFFPPDFNLFVFLLYFLEFSSSVSSNPDTEFSISTFLFLLPKRAASECSLFVVTGLVLWVPALPPLRLFVIFGNVFFLRNLCCPSCFFLLDPSPRGFPWVAESYWLLVHTKKPGLYFQCTIFSFDVCTPVISFSQLR